MISLEGLKIVSHTAEYDFGRCLRSTQNQLTTHLHSLRKIPVAKEFDAVI